MGHKNFFSMAFQCAFSLGLVSPLLAQPLSSVPRQDVWVTDGTVNAVAVTNDSVFIGGDFTYVGPWTGGGVPLDDNTMQPVENYPRVNGSVHAVEPDGVGGATSRNVSPSGVIVPSGADIHASHSSSAARRSLK